MLLIKEEEEVVNSNKNIGLTLDICSSLHFH